ncbi:hypothetical protein B0A48_17319 [Cryoendolithus antarcticus]|uniref:Uncharacterized protein n=1 Tax=Cryoendolithus antarcticus TaxID=1507870 RepID=A0A1V8SC83_9PEZI|nr:hypothetical protein B0A48_17319 [Cryoendolithus antarcticus]
MSSVQIFVQTPTNFGLVDTIDGDLVKRHSDLIGDLVDKQPKSVKYQIILTGVAPAAIKHTLRHIAAVPKTGKLYLNIHHMPIIQAIAIHEAAMLLRLQPEQPQLEGHIIGYASHNVPSPTTMLAIHTVYKTASSRIWKTMIHNMCYNFVGEKIPDAQNDDLQIAAMQYPDLMQAVDAKIEELGSKAEHAKYIKRKKAEKAARKGERAERRKYGRW